MRKLAALLFPIVCSCSNAEEMPRDCAAEGLLDDMGTCVEPWRFGNPLWSTCPNEQHGTAESLHEKADYYDAIAPRLHIHPELGFAVNITLKADAPPEASATLADVERFNSGENDGLWSALYLTSQAYRYAVTKSPDALATIRLLLGFEETRMRITGVPGIFTRQYIKPNVQGISCPTDQSEYIPDIEKDDNQWVKIEEGCVQVVDRTTMQWTKTDHCGLADFEGWCFLDNVSKDEYSGHMLALAALMRLVDDADVQRIARDLLGQVGRHMLAHDLVLVDWDGRSTEHGHFSPIALDDFPGFNAAMAMAYISAARDATDDADLAAYYRKCLLQKDGGQQCLGLTDPDPFTDYLEAAGMYVGPEGCGSNYNNVSMHMLSLHTLLWFERDAPIRAAIQKSLDVDVMRKDGEPRAIIKQHNALFDFIWAADKKLGPTSDGPALEAVEDGICQLKQFRSSQSSPAIALDPVRHAPYCKNRFGDDVSENPRESWERCAATFVWWGDPYSLSTCTEDHRDVHQPAGYLLPYWMARYYGFIPAEL